MSKTSWARLQLARFTDNSQQHAVFSDNSKSTKLLKGVCLMKDWNAKYFVIAFCNIYL